MAQDFNHTLNLPKTDFQMRAGLPQREPKMLEDWNNNKLYDKMMEKNEGKPLYILHDGPPFANGDIHLGTALNKVLKDIIVRYKNMNGFKAPYIPGWDTHGLPIELKAMKKVGVDKGAATPLQIREACKEFALFYMNNQREQFKRLGVVGDWENPYLTLKPEFEAREIRIFGEMAKKGYIYKGLKPVYWCPECETALAEAEIEYSDDDCYSIYVKFNITDDKGLCERFGIDKSKAYFVIWTTTTWTLPGNVAICVGPEYDYCFVKANDEYYVMAKALVASVMEAAGITEYETIGEFSGKELENIETAHPFLDRTSYLIVGDHVTLESGTGCVHTAPGHGVEDFEVCRNYKHLPIVVPVDSKGVLTDLAGEFAGLTTDKASRAIAKKLEEISALFALKKINHQYPHCWRCQHPILFRATEQWFCSIDGFKNDAINEIKGIEWIPGWGEERMTQMVRDRSDWCISRQRYWGVPFPIFFCKDCGKELVNDETIDTVAKLFEKEGSDAWFKYDAHEILPEGTVCPHCGCKEFTKETDTMDGWFDSGVTHDAVLKDKENLAWPADLYLEGNDQYRGWFQSSLLTSVATSGKAPYKAVCTHGWVVDGEGRKMSKSLGNGIAPSDIIKEYGADILRLWVASSDYHADVRVSKDILKQLSEAYRKIRNTARYILSNLYDFNPDTDSVSFDKLGELDKWAIVKLNDLITKVKSAYDKFDFHVVYHAIHNFCVVDMSNFYLDVLKDKLYVEKAESETRRAAQTAIYNILVSLTKLLAPILAFTAEEIWQYIPHSANDDASSVLFNEMPGVFDISVDEKFMDKWDNIHSIRDDVKKALELARASKIIGSSLDAKVTLYCDESKFNFVKSVEAVLPTVFIASQVEVLNAGEGEFKGEYEGISVTVTNASGEKCERCWAYSNTVGQSSTHPTLCSRCAAIID